MENPLQEKNHSDDKTKKRISLKDILIILFLIILAIAITIVLIYVEIKLRESVQNIEVPTDQTLDENDTGQRFWFIDKVEPNNGAFNVKLSSNAGNLRSYDNLISFGLSQNREYFTINTGDQIRVIKLIDESSTNVQIPSQTFSGSVGEAITWDRNNKYFAVGVQSDVHKNGVIWIFNLDGSLKKEIPAMLTYDPANSNKISPVIFSSNEELILVQTFRETDSEDLKDDGSKFSISELPVYLSVYDIEGNLVKEFMARDFDVTGTEVYYRWDTKNVRTVGYYVYKKGKVFDPNQEYLFTKVRV